MSGLYLIEGKGKQPLPNASADDLNALTAENVRETARMHLERVITNFPNSDFRKQAQAALTQLGPSKPADESAKPVLKQQQ